MSSLGAARGSSCALAPSLFSLAVGIKTNEWFMKTKSNWLPFGRAWLSHPTCVRVSDLDIVLDIAEGLRLYGNSYGRGEVKWQLTSIEHVNRATFRIASDRTGKFTVAPIIPHHREWRHRCLTFFCCFRKSFGHFTMNYSSLSWAADHDSSIDEFFARRDLDMWPDRLHSRLRFFA